MSDKDPGCTQYAGADVDNQGERHKDSANEQLALATPSQRVLGIAQAIPSDKVRVLLLLWRLFLNI